MRFLLLLLLLLQQPATASTLYHAIDAHDDGHDRSPAQTLTGSQSRFEMYAVEIAVSDQEFVIRLDSNLPLQGVSSPFAKDGHIGYGDIFLESASGETYAIKFAPNESPLPTGVYGNVVARNAAADNYGSSASANNPAIATNLVMGDRIGIGDIVVAQVEGVPGSGNHRIVVSFPRHLLPEGTYTLSITQECANDLISLPIVAPLAQPLSPAPPPPGLMPVAQPTALPFAAVATELGSIEIPSEFLLIAALGFLLLLLDSDGDESIASREEGTVASVAKPIPEGDFSLIVTFLIALFFVLSTRKT